MGMFIDLAGRRVKTFTVLEYVGVISGQAQWLCECDCGTRRVLRGQALRNGRVKCSCQRGLTKHPLYRTWRDMIRSCYDHKNIKYESMGGAGIKVCDRWLASFECFAEDMGERPEWFELTRINIDSHFSKENCKWTSRKQIMSISKHRVVFTHNGETMSMSDWAKRLGISRERMRQRVADELPDDLMFASKHKKKQIALSLRQKVAADLRGKQPKPADVIKLAKKYGVKDWLIDRAITHNRNIVVA